MIFLDTLKTTFPPNKMIILKKRKAMTTELIQFQIYPIDYYLKWNIMEI